MPLHVSSTCAHHQEVKIALNSLWYHHTYRCDDTRGSIIHFWPPDDDHMCSKHVEAWNTRNYWDKYTEMHGQQNDKKVFVVYMLDQNSTFPYRNNELDIC